MKKRSGKCLVLGYAALFCALETVSCCPKFSGFVTDQQEGIDIVQGVFPAILVQYMSPLGKAHGCQPVVLCDDNIALGYPVGDGEIHAVRAFIKDESLGMGTVKFMGGVTEKKTGDMIYGCQTDGDVHNGTAVSINKNFHRLISQRFPLYLLRS